MKPLGIQMYTVREAAADDYAGALTRVAEIGYKGVETAGFPGTDAAEVGRVAADLGLTVTSAHVAPAIPMSVAELVDMAGALGTDTIVCSVWKTGAWETMDDVKTAAAGMQDVAGQLKSHHIRMGYHNHGYEMLTIDGRIALEHFYDLAPDVMAQIDIYWAANYGRVDVPALVAGLADRVGMLHLKDGSLEEGPGHVLTAIGSGKLDIPPIVAAADESVLEWNIVEIDSTPGDTWEAVQASYDYITGAGLAAGSK